MKIPAVAAEENRQLINLIQQRWKEDRNNVLEEVAKEFDKMKNFGDTASSFAIFVRNMKT
jgi:hypothetical protein